jgi:hypothetical protein
MLVPHAVPFVTSTPVSWQPGVLPVHSKVPLWQGFAGWHDVPCAHGEHAPLMQKSAPHAVPLGAFIPVSVQEGGLVEQSIAPAWQALDVGVHDAPATQAMHPPLSQSIPAPQEVPLVTSIPVSVQVEVPVAHDVVPWWHALVGVHVRPGVQATHPPSSQTSPVPHVVPFDVPLGPVSVQTGTPVAQSMVPWSQGFVGVHGVSGTQTPASPASGTTPPSPESAAPSLPASAAESPPPSVAASTVAS